MQQNRNAAAPSFTARMARWSARHRWRVVIAWVLLVVVVTFASGLVNPDTDPEMGAPGDSGAVIDLLEERFEEADPEETGSEEVVVFSHPSLTVNDDEYRETVQALVEDLRALRLTGTGVIGSTTVISSIRIVGETTSHYDIGASRENSPFVAQNEAGGDVTFALVDLEMDSEEAIDMVVETVEGFQAPEGFEVLIGGPGTQALQIDELVNEDFDRAFGLNLPITFIILIIAFGAAVAAAIPIVLALAAIFIANGLLALITQVYPLLDGYTEIVLLLGLATGIDYSLFIITRFRAERRAGRSREEAIVAASGTSGKAVFFAGATVVFALTGMFLIGNTIFNGIAISAIIVVALAIVISMTLLPALLSLLGDKVNRLRLPFLGRTGEGGGIWGAIADRVLARPAVSAIVVTVGLLALAYPVLSINLGDNGARGLHDDVESKAALVKLEDNFTLGLTSPALVVVDAGEKQNVFAPDIQASVNKLTALVQDNTVSPENPDAAFGEPIQTDINDAGDTELILIPINGDISDDNAIDAMNLLRDELIPQAFEDTPDRALASGNTGFIMDFKDYLTTRTPLVVGGVLALVFVLLLVVFRSIIIPIKAVILNVLSVAAAYGFLVLVFQEGLWGWEWMLDFEATGIINLWLPLFMFSLIFGLSQDYHIFVLSRIKECYEGGKSNEESVSVGIKATAPTITSAAIIIVAVASIFAFTRFMMLKQLGVGLAVAVLIDATLVRSVLLPASMKLLGDWNWYLPSWLQWLPRIRMEERCVSSPAGAEADS